MPNLLETPAKDNGVMPLRLRHTLELRLHELQKRLPATLKPSELTEMARIRQLLTRKEGTP